MLIKNRSEMSEERLTYMIWSVVDVKSQWKTGVSNQNLRVRVGFGSKCRLLKQHLNSIDVDDQ